MAQTADDIPSDDSIPVSLRGERAGTIVETAPTAAAIMQRCAFRLARQGGAMLAIDYGYSGPAAGDTLQAVKAHRFADPFADQIGRTPCRERECTSVSFSVVTLTYKNNSVTITNPKINLTQHK